MASRNITPQRRADKPTFVYGLVDPRNHQLRYVGKTIKVPRVRLLTHLWQARKAVRKKHLFAWLTGLEAAGFKPEIVIFEQVPPGGDWEEAEQFWIAYFLFVGANLCNLTIGGEGAPGAVQSAEQRAATSLRMKGWKIPRMSPAELSRIGKEIWADPIKGAMMRRRLAEGRTPEVLRENGNRLVAWRASSSFTPEMEAKRLAPQKTEFHRRRVGNQSMRLWLVKRNEIIAAQNVGKDAEYRRKQSELKKAQWRDPDSGMWKVFLTHAERDEIRAMLASGKTGAAVARECGLSQSRISQIKHGE